MSERPSFSHRTVFLGLVFSLLLAVGVAYYIYSRYVRFDPVAASHAPQDATFVARLNVEQAVVYEPFREHLLPLFELGRPTGGALGRETRVARFERETSIELGVDLRELVLAQPHSGGWLVLLGGHFRRDGVAAGAQRMLREEGVETRLLASPERLVHPSGVTFGVAADGVMILASAEDLCLDALSATSARWTFATDGALEAYVEGTHARQTALLHLTVLPGQMFPIAVELLPGSGTDAREVTSEIPEPLLSDLPLVGPGLRLEPEPGLGENPSTSGTLSRQKFDAAVANLGSMLFGWLQGA